MTIINWLRERPEEPYWILINTNQENTRVWKTESFNKGINLVLEWFASFWELDLTHPRYKLEGEDQLILYIKEDGKKSLTSIEYGETQIFENEFVELPQHPFIEIRMKSEDLMEYSNWIICKSTYLEVLS